MSKTDKTRPGWLQTFQDGQVRHDHRDGRCIVETFDDVQSYAYNRSWKQAHTCPRRVQIRNERYDASLGDVYWNNPLRWITDYRIVCDHCDNEPTCDVSIPGSYWYRLTKIYGETVPPSTRNMIERTNRRTERDLLRDAARDYNANGDTDIEPEPFRHRHGASWDYW